MNKSDFLDTFDRKVAPGNAALVVIDVQNDFCAPEGVFGKAGYDLSMVAPMVANLKRLIDGARGAGVPVLFVQAAYDPVYLPPTWYERNARMNFDVPRCLTGSWGGDFYGIAPQQGDVIIRKHRFSAFVDTELDLVLRSRDIKTVIATGVATNICVESTARDAFMRDYYVTLVDDASAAYSAEQHDSALKNIAIGFGVVAKVDDILKSWKTYDGNR